MTAWQYFVICYIFANVLAGVFRHGKTIIVKAGNVITDMVVLYLLLLGGGFFK